MSTPPAAALSTIWTPPCGLGAFTNGGSGASSCLPPNWSTYWGGNVGYYSPAICPSGFEPGCSRYITTSGVQGPSNAPGETAWQCVVSGFTCAPSSFASYATSGSSTMVMIQIRWKSSDLSILETHPLTPGRKFVATPTPPPSPSSSTPPRPTPTNPIPDDDSNSGLSTGAKAGIGAGVAAAVLLLCITVIIFIRRHRSAHMDHSGEIQVEVGDPSPTSATTGSGYKPVPSEKAVVPVNVTAVTSPNSSFGPPVIDPSFNTSYNPNPMTSPTQNQPFLSPSPDSTLSPPNNPPVWYNSTSARSSPTQYDTPAYTEPPEASPTPPVPVSVSVPAPGPQTTGTTSELEALRARREALDVQRQRILQLQQIETERAQLDQRISMLEMESGGNVGNNRASR